MTPCYERDGISIYHGDALFVLPELGQMVDAVITDPPYSSGGAMRSDRVSSTVAKYVNSGTIAWRPEFSGDNRDQRSFYAWAALWMSACIRVAKPSAHMISFSDWRQLPTVTDSLQAGGWVWRGIGTWWKPGVRMQRGGLSSSAEYVVWGTSGPLDRGISHAPQNVISAPPVAAKEHIAEKPERVMEWLVPLAPPGGLVLDPFMGSGTTLVAARRLGRRAIGIELDQGSIDVAIRRLSQSELPLGSVIKS